MTMRNDHRPDVEREMELLKDFQRNTVDYVHERLWDPAGTGRFLVADEVGLGKTLVARGLVAKAIDRLWDETPGSRIDIVYICSNAQIAEQNLRRLTVAEYETVRADRLSMLPMVVAKLRDSRVNILSLTPGTSMSVSDGTGKAEERALLHHLLAVGLGSPAVLRQRGWNRFFRGWVQERNYPRRLDDPRFQDIDREFARRFVDQLRVEPFEPGLSPAGRQLGPTTVLEAATRIARSVAHSTLPDDCGVPPRWRDVWLRIVGRMRHLVATAAVDLLDPDLVILDEFQRFRQYLRDDVPDDHRDHDAIELARTIFDHRREHHATRVLLLSATPFVMYSAPGATRGQSHVDDFLLTTTFLSDRRAAEGIARRQQVVREAAMGQGDLDEAARAAREVERDLRRVMCRTERLAQSEERDGMLAPQPTPPMLPTAKEIATLAAATRLGSIVGSQHGIFEYWRSSPYLVSMLEHYQLKDRIRAHAQEPGAEFVRTVGSEGLQLPWSRINDYQQVDLGNPKLRELWERLQRRHAHEVPWIPASMPYYSHGGAFARAAEAGLTKQLVFSSWAVVPRAISMMLSYQAEQSFTTGLTYTRDRSPVHLPWARTGDRLDSTSLFALLYPSTSLASLGDPVAIASELGRYPAPADDVRAVVRERLAGAMAHLPAGPADGATDQHWYWAVPLALDRMEDDDAFTAFLTAEEDRASRTRGEEVYRDHVHDAAGITAASLADLGRRPDDLIEVLCGLALAGPGVSALRAIGRVAPETPLTDCGLRAHAQQVASGFRSLVNTPSLHELIGARNPDAEAYWRAVLATCVDGNLQAVLDEYVHVLIESQGLQSVGETERADSLVSHLQGVLSQRPGTPRVDLYRGNGRVVEPSTEAMRTHFAARFGRESSSDDAVRTEAGIRDAFNSPFWPFVLASTSVGQEGLDFHTYCHAVVHWNLPSNPVDLEQREGRVHRYKGHAVRKNVAARFNRAALAAGESDPWRAAFAAARHDAAAAGWDELTPYWVYPGEAKIERHVPTNPLSTETARLDSLLRMVTSYRLTIGQPRQHDLAQHIGDPKEFAWMALDLAPPDRHGPPRAQLRRP